MIIIFQLRFLSPCLQGSFTSTGLVVSSKLPRFSDMYTLTIASTDPKSISTNEQYISPKVSLSGIFLSVLSLHPLTYVCSHDDIGHMNQYAFISCMLFEDQSASVCFWLDCRFTKDGVLVEGLFWKDVEALIVQYTKETKSK